ncbi:hypothetical protein ABB37_03373 [Leptomonas pyrrhocoris]|uniref:Uncharacterized protein n=1 Tax=Leptomonas pyrrhocoris TaxID=157538 RepID=A0A0N0DWV5_LEPPY|nr:hypothetical protein ABB37_03373 [Leptomonas pyrrhocoris]KPA82265.1 hypothetical protein ABB37_03373 [Leptomonas pyrrhocoris]|eukprot:XP_015660704.1 hypothetical protein ABB37_03373 [Leptomonas pyrrhocoris]
MSYPSLFLTPSPSNHREVAPPRSSPSSSTLTDVVPFEAALQRLVYEKIRTDEQLSGYGVQQAYRGLLYAVRAGTLSLKGLSTTGNSATSSSASAVGASASHTRVAKSNGSVSSSPLVEGKTSRDDINTCAVRGWQAVLYRLSQAAVRSAEDLECAVFLSVRILCDPASAHGEGNERPCCTAEWTCALLHGLPSDESAAPQDSPDARFCHLVQSSHRYQLGFLLILANTLRVVATGQVEGQHLCSNYPKLFNGVATVVLPHVARYAEESLRDPEQTAPSVPVTSTQPPSRLSVELNHFVLHGCHWLTTDVLSAHMDAVDDAVQEKQVGEQGMKKRARRRPRVVDRDQPACVWDCVTLVRNALRRALNWVAEEAVGDGGTVHLGTERNDQTSRTPSVALLAEVSQQLSGCVTDLLKRQEYLHNALLNASREFKNVATRDVHSLTEMTWAHTLQMCFLLRNVTGAWASVHGGLGYPVLCPGQVLPGYRDVLMFMVSALVRIPAVETKQEEEREVFLALDAALCALLTLVSAAPTPRLQSELWASDTSVTQQVHALLVQRALRYRNDRVLKLASLLSRAVLDAAVHNGALAGFATESADQLLELLESGDDAASRCVGELLSVAILQHPYRLVPALFRLLQHGSVATRRHVLQVLSSLPDSLCGDAGSTFSSEAASTARSAADRRRDVLRLLAENLLLQLQDEELCVRMLSSSLFAKVHPADVLQPLINLCVQRDTSGRRQSAALAALTSVLTARTDNAAAYVLLLHSGYQCHSAMKATSTDATLLPLRKSDLTQPAELLSENSPVSRPVPQTPGDILSQSLLYSAAADDADDAREDEDAAGPKDAMLSDGGTQSSSTTSSSTNARRREAHLSNALRTVTDRWVNAALPKWTQATHSLPLLQCLVQQAFCNASSAATAAASLEAADAEDRVQFFLKYILRTTSAITGAGITDARDRAAELVAARVSHLLAIWNTFFAASAEASSANAGAATWRGAVECDAPQLSSVTQESAQAKARMHAALLPLLCLRSCAPHTFARSRLLDDALLSSSTNTGNEAQTEAIMAAKEVEDALKENNASVMVEGVYDQVVSSIWQSLWSALTRTEATGAFFALYPDIQRVVLEVLCRFPATVFFTQWQRWKRASVADADGSNTDSDASPPPPTDTVSAKALFVYRVYVYGVSAYLAASLASESSTQFAQSTPTSLDVVLQHRRTLVYVLSTVLPTWLIEDRGMTTRADASAEASLEAAKQRLCMAAVDAGGILGVVALTYPVRTRVNSGDASSVELDILKQDLESASDELLRAALHNLTLAYRATEAEKESSNSDTGAGVPVASETPWTVLLIRFQLCLRMHASLLRAITVHPRESKPLLLLWFRHYLRFFIDLGNAACKSVVGRTEHGCRAAADACGAVFHAVLTARKMDDGAATDGASSSASPVAPTLCRLAWEEKDALVSFAVGCTRFAASPAVQTMGVRLLSSLLVAAPEIFLEVGSQQQEGKGATVVRTAAAAGGGALQGATSALEFIALIHDDRPTRMLAEEVLRMLEKAYSTAGVVST